MNNNLSKDIILKICTMLDFGDILNMRLLSKHYNRIIFDHVKKKYNFKLVKIIAWIFNCYHQLIINNDLPIVKNVMIKNKIQSIENISTGDICMNDFTNICEMLKQVKRITTNSIQEKYDFLLLFEQLENIVISDKLSNKNMEKFPLLETVKYLSIDPKYFLILSTIIQKFPNIENLVCGSILFDDEKIYKIKSLRITDWYEMLYDEVIFEDLEEIIVDILPFGNKQSKLGLKMPVLKKIKITMGNIMCLKDRLSVMIFDTGKIEYLEIINLKVAKIFVSMYSSHEFQSLKKINLGEKYILSNNKIIRL